MSKLIFAGPYVGELGWELFCWQGYLRQLAADGNRIIVSARPGHEAIYEDFMESFVPFTPPEGHMPDGYRMQGLDIDQFADMVPEGAEWLKPIDGSWAGGVPHVDNQKFINFGKDYDDPFYYDILIHARNRQWGPTVKRNWPIEKWEEFARGFPEEWNVGWIGTVAEASFPCLPWIGDDLRDEPLPVLMRYMNYARLVVGPSSGPLHLANLCGAPHVVWSGNARDTKRYAQVWNPEKVPHTMIMGDWQPSVAEVWKAVRGMVTP